MNYEIAKELKVAGFPQKIDEYKWHYTSMAGEEKPRRNWGRITNHGANTDEPTLSELIEACGEMFVLHSPNSLDVNEEYYQHSNKVWTAYSQRKEKRNKEEGLTPEEAVAKLWLALNKK